MDITGPAYPTESRIPPASSGTPPRAAGGDGFHPFGEDGFDFWDLLDIVNPLQHLPVVSTLYRRITGDELAPLPRIAGGALFGGVVGSVTSLANVIVDETTGRDIAGNLLALVDLDSPSAETEPEQTELMVAAGPSQAATPSQTAGLGAGTTDLDEAGTLIASATPGPAMAAAAADDTPRPETDTHMGVAWRAMFKADFYDAEAFDPKRGLIDEAPAAAPAKAVANVGPNAPLPASPAPATPRVASAAPHAAALAQYAQAPGPTVQEAGRRLDLSG